MSEGNSSQRTAKLREEIRIFLEAKGVQSFALAFSDPDTNNWTWIVGNNTPHAVGMAELMLAEIKSDTVNGK